VQRLGRLSDQDDDDDESGAHHKVAKQQKRGIFVARALAPCGDTPLHRRGACHLGNDVDKGLAAVLPLGARRGRAVHREQFFLAWRPTWASSSPI
jgi:hypothetical protein